jgi:hypothetical protein
MASFEEENETLKEKLYKTQKSLEQMTLLDEAKTRGLDKAQLEAGNMGNENTEDGFGSGSGISEED